MPASARTKDRVSPDYRGFCSWEVKRRQELRHAPRVGRLLEGKREAEESRFRAWTGEEAQAERKAESVPGGNRDDRVAGDRRRLGAPAEELVAADLVDHARGCPAGRDQRGEAVLAHQAVNALGAREAQGGGASLEVGLALQPPGRLGFFEELLPEVGHLLGGVS